MSGVDEPSGFRARADAGRNTRRNRSARNCARRSNIALLLRLGAYCFVL
jgi:hypothetical protein